MRALESEVVDAVWAAVEALLPSRADVHPLGCRNPRIPDRVCFVGILTRLVTGCSWVTAERLLGGRVSDTTLRARRDEWIEAGVFDALGTEAIAAYDRIVGLDLTDVAIDGSQHKAPCGGEGTGRNPTDRGKRGWKWSLMRRREGRRNGHRLWPSQTLLPASERHRTLNRGGFLRPQALAGRPEPPGPVGAGNSAVVVDLPRCGPMLIRRVPNLVPIPGVTGSAHCAVRPLQGPRDHRLAPPTRRAAPTRRPTRDHRRRPELARGEGGRAAATEPSRVAGHRRHAVGLAPPPHRRALDSTTATAGPPIDLSEASPTHTAPRSRESNLAISPRPGRTRQARPPPCCVHGLADPQQRRNRPRPHTLRSHLVAVPRSQAAVACDFATIETVTLRRFCLLLCIDIGTRTVHRPMELADPHSPWQRGQIENLNRQVRWWFPRGTDLRLVTPTQAEHAADIINHQRRRSLHHQSPAELYAALTVQ